MKKHPFIILILAISVLVLPTLIYLIILVPQLSDEYNTLMASGGIIGSVGVYGTSKIPDKWKYGGLFKTASNSFTILIVSLIVEKFIVKIAFLFATIVVSFIIYKILMEVWRNAKQSKSNRELANEISRNLNENSK